MRTAPIVLASILLAACGGAPPPATPTATAKTAPVVRGEAPPDISPVAEPPGLVVVGRVAKPDGILKTVGGWVHLPLPGGADLVRSMTDDAVGDVVDLGQPVDGAVALGGTKRDPQPLAAFSVAVKSFDSAKNKLGAKHKLTPGPNGSYWIAGIVPKEKDESARGEDEDGDGDPDDDDGTGCALAHGATGPRLVCGPKSGVDALMPYLTRNLARQSWPSDVHLEVRAAPAREPMQQLQTLVPLLAGGLMQGTGSGFRDLVDATMTEAVDVVNDTDRILLDAQIQDAGTNATLRIDFQRAQSFMAKASTARADKMSAPPAAFFHLPGETDLAFYSTGSDPALYQRPREIVGNILNELMEKEQMPDAERRALRDLVAERTWSLFQGPLVYGKGYDPAAVDKALDAKKAVKEGDRSAMDQAETALAAQVIGWHLVQTSEPIAKVGPLLKEWAALWSRPAFTKWAKTQSSSKMLAQVKVAPAPAGVTLPKDAVHLEITVPQDDLELEPVSGPVAVVRGPVKPLPPKPATKGKKVPRKPIVFHVLAIPDGGATWIGFGLDAKLVATKALASLSSAPDTSTFGRGPTGEKLRDVKANGAWAMTLRGLLVFAALDGGSKNPYRHLGSLTNKGNTPIVLAFSSRGPSPQAAAGSSVTTMNVPRAAIEDIVRLALASH